MLNPDKNEKAAKIRYGDKVTFFDAKVEGFLTQLGDRNGEVGVHVARDNRKRNSVYQKYLFEVLPFDEPVGSEMNAAHRRSSEEVCYGDKIKLRHVYSQQLLCVLSLVSRISSSWVGEGDNLKLSLEDNATHKSYFRIVPSFKVRQEGQVIEANDEINLEHAEIRPSHFLSSSATDSTQCTSCDDIRPKEGDKYYEANLSVSKNTYAIRAFDTSTTPEAFLMKRMVKIGDPILLYHKDYESYVNIKIGATARSFTMHRVGNPNLKMRSYRSNSFFYIEHEDTDKGGFIPMERPVRVKHLASGLYLSHTSTQDGCTLGVIPEIGTDDSVTSTQWLFTSKIIPEGVTDVGKFLHQVHQTPDDHLQKDQIVRLAGIVPTHSDEPVKPFVARCWLGTTTSTSAEWDNNLELSCQPRQVFQDALQVMIAPQLDIVHEINTIVRSKPTIMEYISWWRRKDEEAAAQPGDVANLQQKAPHDTLLQSVLYHLQKYVALLTPPDVVPEIEEPQTVSVKHGKRRRTTWVGLRKEEKHTLYQQTMLDQDIHVFLMDCLTVPFEEVGWTAFHNEHNHKKSQKTYLTRGRFNILDLQEPQYRTFKSICVNIYMSLSAMIKDNEKAAVEIMRLGYIYKIQDQLLWHKIQADLCLEVLLRHYEVVKFLDEKVVVKFCDDLNTLSQLGEKDSGTRLHGQHRADGECTAQRIVQLMRMCCVCEENGQPISNNQRLVLKHFLEDDGVRWQKGRNIIHHKIGHSGLVEVSMNEMLWLPSKHVPSIDLQRMLYEGLGVPPFAEKAGNSSFLVYNVACIELFAAMCKGRVETNTKEVDPVVAKVQTYFEHSRKPEITAVQAMIEAQKAGGSAGPGKAAIICPAFAALVREWISDDRAAATPVFYSESTKANTTKLLEWGKGKVKQSFLPAEQDLEVKSWIKSRCSDLSFLLQKNQTMKLLLSALTLCKRLVLKGTYTLGQAELATNTGGKTEKPLFDSFLAILDPATDGRESGILTEAQRRMYSDINLPIFSAKLEVCRVLHATLDMKIWHIFVQRAIGVEIEEGNTPFWSKMSFAEKSMQQCENYFPVGDVQDLGGWLHTSAAPFDFSGDVSPNHIDSFQQMRDLTHYLMELTLYQWVPIVDCSLDLLLRLHSVPLEVSNALNKVIMLEHRDERRIYKEISDLAEVLVNKQDAISVTDSDPSKASIVAEIQNAVSRTIALCLPDAEDMLRSWDEFVDCRPNAQAQRLISSTSIIESVLTILSSFIRAEEQYPQVPAVPAHPQYLVKLLRSCYRLLTVYVKDSQQSASNQLLLNWVVEEKLKLHIRHERRAGPTHSRMLLWDVSYFLTELTLHYKVCVLISTYKDLIWVLVSQLNPGVLGSGRSPRHLKILKQLVLVQHIHTVDTEGPEKVTEVHERVIESSLTTVINYIVMEKKRVLMLLRDTNEQERDVRQQLISEEVEALIAGKSPAFCPPLDKNGPLQYHIELVELFSCALKGNTAVMTQTLAFNVMWPVDLAVPVEYSYPLFFMRPYLMLLSAYLHRDDKAPQVLSYTGPKGRSTVQKEPVVWNILNVCVFICRALVEGDKTGSDYLHKCYNKGAGARTYQWLQSLMKACDKSVRLPTYFPVWFCRAELETFVLDAVVPFINALTRRVRTCPTQSGQVRMACKCVVHLCELVISEGFLFLNTPKKAKLRQLLNQCITLGLSPDRVELGSFEATDQPEGFILILKRASKRAFESLSDVGANGGQLKANDGVGDQFIQFREDFARAVRNPAMYTENPVSTEPLSRARLLAFSRRSVNGMNQYLLREYVGQNCDAEDDKDASLPTMMTLDNFTKFANLLVSNTLPMEHVASVLNILAFGFAEEDKVNALETQRVKQQGIQSDLAAEALNTIDKRKREIQVMFNKKAATQKVFMLMETLIPRAPEKMREIHTATLSLAKQLLDGGTRKEVQMAIYQFFIERPMEGFFVFCRDQIKSYELEIKSWDLQSSSCTQQQKLRLCEMEVLFRVLQLLCEGHMTKLQNFLREQPDNPFSVNVVREVAMFTRYLTKEITHEAVLPLIMQGFVTLTEFCQGPCKGNQETLVEAKMPSVVGVLLERTEEETCDTSGEEGLSFDDVLSEAIGMLLSLTEGVTSMQSDLLVESTISKTDVPQKLLDMLRDNNQANLYNLLNKMNESWIKGHIVHATRMKGLVWKLSGKDTEEVSAEEEGCGEELQLGYNIFIFILSLCRFDKTKVDDRAEPALLKLLKSQMSYAYFNRHVGQIEIGRDEQLEKVYFVLPDRCKLLPEESKAGIQVSVKRDSRETKIQDFFSTWSDLVQEINIYDEANKQPNLQLFIKYGKWLEAISLFLSLVISAYLMGTMKRKNGPSKEYLSDTDYIGFNVLAIVQIFIELWLFFGWMQIKGRVIVFKFVQRAKNEVVSQKVRGPDFNMDTNIDKIRSYADWARHSAFMKAYLSLTVLLRHKDFYVTTLFAAAAPVGYFANPIFFSLQIFRVIKRSDSLQNVIKSVTSKYQDLLWTAGLGMVVIFLFSMVSFYYFSDKYYDVKRNPDLGQGFSCQELWRCFILNVVYGLRQGGGLADVLQHPDWHKDNVWPRLAFDFAFWLVMIIIFLNIIFGIILDTFAELRDKKQDRERDMKSKCFICGKEAYEFDKSRQSSFTDHYHKDHNMWSYLFFYVYLFHKSPELFTGQESYVWHKIERNLTDFFPEDAIALEEEADDDDAEEEEREKRIESKLDKLIKLVSGSSNGQHAVAAQRAMPPCGPTGGVGDVSKLVKKIAELEKKQKEFKTNTGKMDEILELSRRMARRQSGNEFQPVSRTNSNSSAFRGPRAHLTSHPVPSTQSAAPLVLPLSPPVASSSSAAHRTSIPLASSPLTTPIQYPLGS